MVSAVTFLYFAYGSNLLTQRIHANNPTAIRKGIAKLKDYRLDFAHWSTRWKGAVATIVPDPGQHVWGAVWELNVSDIENLDRQEGVASQVYDIVYVTVETPEQGQTISCRSYQLHDLPARIDTSEPVPADRKPSLAYHNVILEGAAESELPDDYVSELKKIPDNGNLVAVEKLMLVEPK